MGTDDSDANERGDDHPPAGSDPAASSSDDLLMEALARGLEAEAASLEQRRIPLGTTAVAGPAAPGEAAGSWIGPYKVLQKIGDGGMGDVFLAEQEKPIRRKVALKLIKPGLDTAHVVARFEAERQALAIMDHPNIAKVLDVGATPAGRPFFVMELVKGVPITDYCDQNRLSPRERLELFIPVCRAIQHAHQKGIIHRDIKPSNVLMTEVDGKPEPKVIDFGVAKAIDQRLTERTMFTEFGAIVGTLEYMSPEQAEMGALDIDTRSDIYSLGVLLYELLTGSTPMVHAWFCRAPYPAVLHRIRHDEVPYPSVRVAESHEMLAAISAKRKIDPARLCRLIRGELDWIALKALDKDRTRRYETANGLARDIQRHLDGDPVEASPPSASYKLGKFARKYRLVFATTAAFAALLLAATGISLGLALWANAERVRANVQRARAFAAETRAEAQRDRAVAAEKLAVAERTRVQDREDMAIAALRHYGDVVSNHPELKNDSRLASLRKLLLKEPRGFFQRLRDQLQADQKTTTDSLTRLAVANDDLGKLADEIGDKQEALNAWRESRLIWERLTIDHPKVLRFWEGLADNFVAVGSLQRYMNWRDDALASFEASRVINERLVHAEPNNPGFQQKLAWSRTWIAAMQTDTGRLVEASASLEAIHLIRERLAREAPHETRYQLDLAVSHNDLGENHRAKERATEALRSHEEARRICERLAREDPSNIQFQIELANSLHAIGEGQIMVGRLSAALDSHQQALQIWTRLARDHPSNTRLQIGVGTACFYLGNTYFKLGLWSEAMAFFEQRCTVYERLIGDNPQNLRLSTKLATCRNNVGLVHWNAGRFPEALVAYELARSIRDRLVHEDPTNLQFQADLALSHDNLGWCRYRLGLSIEAVRLLEAARGDFERLVQEKPTSREFQVALETTCTELSLVHQEEGRSLDAASHRDRARAIRSRLDATDPALVALDERLEVVVRGGVALDNAERLALARRAYQRHWPRWSARLYAEAFASEPQLGVDRRAQHAYKAGCAAALAGTGRGWDDPPASQGDRTQLRHMALVWLQAELAAWTQVQADSPPDLRMQVVIPLGDWKAEDDLMSIRDERYLAKLPDAERADFRRLWTGVDELMARARGSQ